MLLAKKKKKVLFARFDKTSRQAHNASFNLLASCIFHARTGAYITSNF